MKLLDFDNSYIYQGSRLKNRWRTSIKSTLKDCTNGTNFYLAKECRAERIGDHPFSHPELTEFNAILEDNSYKYVIRNKPIFRNDKNERSYFKYTINNKEVVDSCIIKEIDYELLEFDSILDNLENTLLKNIYCKIDYQFENKNYSLFSKVDYINFAKKNSYSNENYIQPIMGYLPFKKNSTLYIAYAAIYISSKKKGDLEFKIRKNTEIKNFYIKNNNFSSKLKYFLLSFFNFLKISEFSETVTIKNSVCNFYIK